MNVKVCVDLSEPPDTGMLKKMQWAADCLTNNEDSVRVSEDADEDSYSITAEFTMKNAAQYKVVDEIFDSFKMYATNTFDDYRDIAVSFPKSPSGKRKRRQSG